MAKKTGGVGRAGALSGLLGSLVLGMLLAACDSNRPAPPLRRLEHLIVISVDGLLPDYYMDPQLSGNFPGLARLKREGSFAERVRGVVPTLTFPSHTSLITGVDPACHGIETNLIFDPLKRNRGGWNWYAEDIRSDTLWDAAARAGLSTGSVFWPVTVGANIDFLVPAFWQINGGLDGIRLLRALSTPGLLAEIEERFGPYDPARQSDYERVEIGLEVFLKHRPALMLIKLSDLDGAQHDAGPGSAQAIETLQKIDAGIRYLLSTLETEDLLGRTAIALVSDHGSTPVHFAVRPERIFQEQGWVTVRNGRVTDWVATPVIAGGLCAVVLKDPGDETTLDQIKKTFRTLQATPDSGIGKIYEKDEIRGMKAFRNASLLIETAPDYRMVAGAEGPVSGDSPDSGAHGYTPEFGGQHASFLLRGPGIAAGSDLGELNMIDIAPRLAQLLRIELKRDCPAGEEGQNSDGHR